MEIKKTYTEDSIQSLEPLEFVRLRPSVYCGSVEYSTQLATELLANSVDEFQIGNAQNIIIKTLSDYTYELSDDGQGILPNTFREDGKTVFEAALSQLNTSGKYNSSGVYEGSSIGVNGIGAKLTTFLSHWLEAVTWRDGKYERIWFKEGKFDKRETGIWKDKANPHGMKVIWQPNEEFFNHPEIEENKIKDLIKSTVCLCQGLVIKFNDEVYFSKNGIDDLVDDSVKNNEILKNRLRIQYQNNKDKLDLSLTYSNGYSTSIIPYVNTGFTSSGPHITQIKTIITREFNKFFREKKWLKEKDANLTGDDINEGMCLVFHLVTTDVGYDGQLKDRIVKLDMTPFSGALTENIQLWLERNEKDIKQIADKALNARKAREAAKKAREAVRSKEKKKTVLEMPSKLADCNSTNRPECELYVTEGDSASGGAKTIRNAKTQAVLGLRGKVLNVLTADLEKIHKNVEIMDIIKALGFSWTPDGKQVIYDPKNLRYGKFIIAADRDSDGSHIQLLVLTCLWQLVPQLILDGYVYVALPPLYKAEWGTKYQYLQDKPALEEFRKTHNSFTLSYFKGLGEADPQELGQMIMNPETRLLQKVTVEDVQEADKIIKDLMGKDSMPKKKFVFGNEIKEII